MKFSRFSIILTLFPLGRMQFYRGKQCYFAKTPASTQKFLNYLTLIRWGVGSSAIDIPHTKRLQLRPPRGNFFLHQNRLSEENPFIFAFMLPPESFKRGKPIHFTGFSIKKCPQGGGPLRALCMSNVNCRGTKKKSNN